MLTKTTLSLFLLPLFAMIRPGQALAQDSGPATIHVVETLHSDGTRTVMKTDPDNHTAESSTYDAANKIRQRTVFNLDESGQAVGGTVYSSKNVAIYKLVYKRDSMNRVNEVDSYTMKDVLLNRMIYHYDAKGKVTGIDTYDPNGNVVRNISPPGGAIPGKKKTPVLNH